MDKKPIHEELERRPEKVVAEAAERNRMERGQGEPEEFFPARKSVALIAGILILFGLYLSSLYNFLLFHTLAEVFSIVVACGIFMIAWNSRRILDNNYLLFIGIAFLFIGVLDLVHTLAYKGMNVFQGYETNLPTQLWIAARYMESISLLIAPLFLSRRLRADLVLMAYALATFLVLGSVFYWHIFPACFVEGVGLTPFKKISEYVISIILIGAIAVLFQKRKDFDKRVFRMLVASIALTIASELAFTFYIHAYGFSNLVGHYFKIISFYLIYKALIATGLMRPYDLLFRNLKQSENALRESEAQKAAILDGITTNLAFVNGNLEILWANKTAADSVNRTVDEMIGRKCYELWADPNTPCDGCPTIKAFETKRTEQTIIHTPDKRVWEEKGEPVFDGKGRLIGVLEIAHDITARAQVEETLRSSEAKYRRLAENSPAVVYQFMMTPEGAYSFPYVSRSMLDMTGIPAEAVMRDAGLFLDKMHPEDQDWFYESVIKSAETLEPWHGISRFSLEGKGRWIEGHSTPAPLPDGRILWDGFLFDVTDRKHAEDALRTAEATYRNMFLNSQIGLFRTDMKTGMILDANDAVARFIGYKDRSELMAGPFNIVERYVDPKEREKMISLLQAHGEFRNYETRFRRNDGSIIWMRYSAKMVPEKGWVEGVSEDISDQKLAEISLRQSEEKFSKLFFSSPAWMAITRLEDGTYLEVNKAFEKITGFDRSEVIGRTSLELGLWPEPDGERERYMALVRERGGFREQQVTFLAKDGEPITALWSAYMMDLAGETCLLSTVMDMSALKRSRVERKKLYAQLLQAQKMESIGRLAGGIAHDFNNKLVVILGRAEMLLMDMEPENPIYGSLEEIQNAAEGSADLTRQLLAFARKQTISPRELDLNETLEGMLKMLRRLIGENIDLAWQPDTNLWSVKMDPAQIDQILANLAVNARDAIDGVGKVTIETKNVVLGEAYCAEHVGFVPGEFAMLAVSDNGGGMDETTLDQIFEPFFTTKGIGKGTGLGLSTVYGIVKQNNGFVNAYSEPGKGTTFKIYVPRYQGDANRETSTGSEETPKGLGETILLVEDDPGILEMVGMMLERLGYAVLTANGPDEAMEIAREHSGRIHLLMTDVVMPRMNGKDLAEQVMKIRPETGTLFMSGYTANAIAHHGILNEGVHFIEKPFMADGLARKVREVLDKTKKVNH